MTLMPATRVSWVLVIATCAAMPSLAQEASPCPTVAIASAAEVNSPDAAEFKVSVTGGSADVDPLYNWTVSAGTISSGQGTSSIQVATDGMAAGDVIEAEVEVRGFQGSCDTSASASIKVVKKATKVFEAAYKDDAELARLLDGLVGKREPDGKAYIVFHAGRDAPAGELDRLKKTAKAHIETRGEDPANYPFMDGGTRDQTSIEFWLAGPEGEAPPLGTAD